MGEFEGCYEEQGTSSYDRDNEGSLETCPGLRISYLDLGSSLQWLLYSSMSGQL